MFCLRGSRRIGALATDKGHLNVIMKKIAFLSFVAALGGILFGYDTAVISGTIAAVGEQFRLDAMAKGGVGFCPGVGW